MVYRKVTGFFMILLCATLLKCLLNARVVWCGLWGLLNRGLGCLQIGLLPFPSVSTFFLLLIALARTVSTLGRETVHRVAFLILERMLCFLSFYMIVDIGLS